MDGPRQARPEEIEALTDLVATVFGFTFYDRGYMVAGMRRPVMDTARMIAEGGVPVSYIHAQDTRFRMYGCTTGVSSIGCVCTREDRRGQGHAGAILEHQIARLDEAGIRLMVVSGNRSLYRRNHCVPAGFAYEAKLTPAMFPARVEGLSVRQVTLDDWPTLAPLYRAEPAHFLRPADLEQNLCFWWNCNGPAIYLIEAAGRPVAYLVVSRHRESRWVSEYAGSRAALLDAMPLVFEASGASMIEFQALAQDTELRYRFARMGVETTAHPSSGTIRLINLPGLVEDLRDYQAARLTERDLSRLSFTQEDETCTFALGREQLELDLSNSARLVCGGPSAPLVEGDLGRVLSALFPLPTIQPGFNYV